MITFREKIISSIIWIGSTQILAQIITWVITIYVARILSPTDYGLMGMAALFIGFIKFINEFGLGSAIVQKKFLTQDEIHSLFWISLFNSIIIFVVNYIISPVIANFFGYEQLKTIIRFLGFNFLLGPFIAIPSSLLAKELKFDKKSKAVLISKALGSILVLFFAIVGFGVWSLVFGAICSQLLLAIMISYYSKYVFKFQLKIKKIIKLITFGGNVTLSRISWFVYSNSDFLIIGKVLGNSALGFYSLAFQIASIPIDKIATIINPVAFSSFSKLQGQDREIKKLMLKFTRSIALVIFPVLSGLAFISDDFVNTVLTSKWAPMIFPIRVLCIVGILKSLSFIIAPMLNARRKASKVLLYNVLSLFIMPISFFIGSFFNLTGVSIAWLIAYPIIFFYTLYVGLREINLKAAEYIQNIMHVVIATVSMIIFLFLLEKIIEYNLNDILKIMVLVTTGASTYLIILYKFFPVFKSDILALKKTSIKEL